MVSIVALLASLVTAALAVASTCCSSCKCTSNNDVPGKNKDVPGKTQQSCGENKGEGVTNSIHSYDAIEDEAHTENGQVSHRYLPGDNSLQLSYDVVVEDEAVLRSRTTTRECLAVRDKVRCSTLCS